jgi:hypothetical protein
MDELIIQKLLDVIVVCWIKRVKRLGINASLDENFEKELMKAVEAKNHQELEANLTFLHDETFVAIVESIIKQRKKTDNHGTTNNIYA